LAKSSAFSCSLLGPTPLATLSAAAKFSGLGVLIADWDVGSTRL
jgi:hypothetical protein